MASPSFEHVVLFCVLLQGYGISPNLNWDLACTFLEAIQT